MAMKNPYETYKNNSVNTASPGELTLMLYKGCLKFIRQAKKAIQEMDIQGKNTYILKAENIIHELMVTLNMNIPVAKDLYCMYDYVHNRLIEANINNDIAMLEEVESFILEFHDTWKQVIIEVRKQVHQGGNV